jgi:hypothetical protein
MLKTTILSVAAIALLTTGCVMDELGNEAQDSHSWGNYHWARTSNPFTIKLGDNVDSNWQQYLVDADNDWDSSNVLDTTIVAGGTKARRCAATTGQVEVCNAAYGNTGWLGIAGIYASGDHITKGYVKLNDTYYAPGTSYDTPAWRRLVTCQEVGHTFGLGHQDENFNNNNLNTCMDYTNSPDSNQHPNNHDYQLLSSIYNHLDSTTTVGVRADTETAAADEDDFGELIEVSLSGTRETYRKELGNGEVLVRHVTWADGAHTLPGTDTSHTH